MSDVVDRRRRPPGDRRRPRALRHRHRPARLGPVPRLLHRRLRGRLRRHRCVAQRRRDHVVDGGGAPRVRPHAAPHHQPGREPGRRRRSRPLLRRRDRDGRRQPERRAGRRLLRRRAGPHRRGLEDQPPPLHARCCSRWASTTTPSPEGDDMRAVVLRDGRLEVRDTPIPYPVPASSCSGRSAPPSARRTSTSWTITTSCPRAARPGWSTTRTATSSSGHEFVGEVVGHGPGLHRPLPGGHPGDRHADPAHRRRRRRHQGDRPAPRGPGQLR